MERRAHFNEHRGIDGELSIAFDLASGRIELRGTGFWSVRQVSAHFAELSAIIGEIHAAGTTASVLVDLTEGVIQSPEVAHLIATNTARLYADGDAIAMLVSTSLAKMQMRRVLDPRFHDFFLSRSAAETWLRGRRLAAEAGAQIVDEAV